MAGKFESREAVAAKIEWEGGLFEALDYGLKSADMPEGDAELTEAWRNLEAAYAQAERLGAVVEALLPDGG